MNKSTRSLFILFIVLTFSLLSACGTNGIKGALNYEIDDFSYQNQDGKTVSLNDLKGEIWIANFIFTSCDTVCPPMTAHMTELQKQLKEEGLDVRFVSFSVDPEVDSPDKLKEFAGKYPLSLENWDFLTGYSQEDIDQFAKNSFKTIVQKPEGQDQVIHGTLFYLIDQNGKVMKDYNGVENTPYDEIIEDVKKIQ
ncbi:SCO family protein [Metabacillus idriensis]|uniref:SCO family protein n=1 Tax=Metabacillus idriensis TaxID=324768 RepID=UPI001747E117|nr:SCO family protein [Metabacillus idriensis]